MVGAERTAGTHFGDTRLLGGVDQVVDAALHVGEPAADRKSPGDVRGVERGGLHTRVEQQQVTGAHRSVVAHPVQRGGVRPGRSDRAVADIVAFHAGPQEEGAFNVAFRGGLGLRQRPDDVFEAADRGVDGPLELGDLPVVFDETRVVQEDRELFVALLVLFAVVPSEERRSVTTASRVESWPRRIRVGASGASRSTSGRVRTSRVAARRGWLPQRGCCGGHPQLPVASSQNSPFSRLERGRR